MEETKRKLASIQKIVDIQPIKDSDFLEVATVLGWHCVVLKSDNFKVGSNVVYFEVDSLLPLREEFEFLAKGSSPKKMLVDGEEVQGYRIKTIRLRGQISQGLVMPLSILSETTFISTDDETGVNYEARDERIEGEDVTTELGVYKYEIPLPASLAGKARGGFPGFLPKTDELRLQGIPAILDTYKELPFYVTEKVDGSSCTVVIKNDEFHVCSRSTDWLDDGTNSYWQAAKELEVEKKMRNAGLAEKIALQGELVGPSIQKNTLKLSKPTLMFFNAYDFEKGRYLDYIEYFTLFKDLGLETVPLVTPDFKLLPTVDEMVAFATRKSVKNPDVWLEGLVFRPLVEVQDSAIGRLSFKVINPEYLLKHES